LQLQHGLVGKHFFQFRSTRFQGLRLTAHFGDHQLLGSNLPARFLVVEHAGVTGITANHQH
jgi:hypothetical protein